MKMRVIKSLLVTTAVVGLVAMMGVRSFADVIPPLPSTWIPGQELKGEVTVPVTSDNNPQIDPLPFTIDWIVKAFDINDDGMIDLWGYFYQIENTSLATISSITIATPYHQFFWAGVTSDNLDSGFYAPPPIITTIFVSAHDLPDTENATGGLDEADFFERDVSDVTWYFIGPKLRNGYQSGLLFAYSNMPPTYGGASANDGNITWGVGYGVPIPSPEPSTVALIALGILGGVFMRRRLIV